MSGAAFIINLHNNTKKSFKTPNFINKDTEFNIVANKPLVTSQLMSNCEKVVKFWNEMQSRKVSGVDERLLLYGETIIILIESMKVEWRFDRAVHLGI